MDLAKQIFKAFKGLIIAVIIGVVVVFGGVYKLSEQEVGVKYTLGEYTSVEESAGWHFKIPFIQRVSKVNMVSNESQIGYSTQGENTKSSIFSSDDEDGEEEIEEDEDHWEHVSGDGVTLTTKDTGLVNMGFYAEWKISDPVETDMRVEDPKEMVDSVLMTSIREVVSGFTVDEALTDGKAEIEMEIIKDANDLLDEYGFGLVVTSIRIQDSTPPSESVTQAFRDVENARQQRITDVNNANKTYNSTIPNARADADKILMEAEAYREKRILDAEGQTARFEEMYKEYKHSPKSVGQKLYYEMLDEVLPKLNIIIDGSGNTLKIIGSDGVVQKQVNVPEIEGDEQ